MSGAPCRPTVAGMCRTLRVPLLLLLLAGLVGCARHEGNAETDRIAETVAVAISYPQQTSAEGFARAALATAAGQDGRLAVVGVEPMAAQDPLDPIARLVWRIHLPGTESGWVTSAPVTACYDVAFNRYGNVAEPARRRCPGGATPIVPSPETPAPQPRIPDDAEAALEQLLRDLPPQPGQDRAAELLRQALPVTTAPVALITLVEVRGADVGISLSEGPGQSCLLAARVSGRVLVWRPALVQVQPGELTCDPSAALALQGTAPAH